MTMCGEKTEKKKRLPGCQMKNMVQEREHDELGQVKMENWPLDLTSRRLFQLH